MKLTDGWRRKFKGTWSGGAKIYTHPEVKDGRAIVVNGYGVHFNGETFDTLDDAKRAALTGRAALEQEGKSNER